MSVFLAKLDESTETGSRSRAIPTTLNSGVKCWWVGELSRTTPAKRREFLPPGGKRTTGIKTPLYNWTPWRDGSWLLLLVAVFGLPLDPLVGGICGKILNPCPDCRSSERLPKVQLLALVRAAQRQMLGGRTTKILAVSLPERKGKKTQISNSIQRSPLFPLPVDSSWVYRCFGQLVGQNCVAMWISWHFQVDLTPD